MTSIPYTNQVTVAPLTDRFSDVNNVSLIDELWAPGLYQKLSTVAINAKAGNTFCGPMKDPVTICLLCFPFFEKFASKRERIVEVSPVKKHLDLHGLGSFAESLPRAVSTTGKWVRVKRDVKSQSVWHAA